jgi:hypothetical protein
MLYSQLGYYFTGKIAQYKIKEEMKEKIVRNIPDSFLEAIPLPGNENNIDWEDEGREFSFKGEMYDVVRTKKINGQIIFYCINDKKEDLLLAQLNDITKSNNQNTGKNSQLPDIKLVYDCVITNHIDYFILSFHKAHACIHYSVALTQQTAAIIAPPPRA